MAVVPFLFLYPACQIFLLTRASLLQAGSAPDRHAWNDITRKGRPIIFFIDFLIELKILLFLCTCKRDYANGFMRH